jgi:vanillate O-demethylase monooxygenase subunit
MQVMHTVTPVSDGTCRFFWKLVRNYALDDAGLTHHLFDDSETVLAEDKRILEAQQIALDGHPDRGFYDLNIDAAAVWSRRMTGQLIAAEVDHRVAAATP